MRATISLSAEAAWEELAVGRRASLEVLDQRMEVQIDPHTLERAEERGTSEQEIQDVIASGFRIPAKYGRIGKAKVYDFGQHRQNRYYEQKRVEVFYTIEENVVITVTAYVFYGRWDREDADTI